MYNHMVGQTASVTSPFYSLLPGKNQKKNIPASGENPDMGIISRGISRIDIFGKKYPKMKKKF